MFNFEGNAAEKLPQEFPQEEAPKTGEERLRELRIMQINFGPDEKFSEEELKEFLELQNEESGVMTNFEKDRYRQLTIKRDNEGLSETERLEFVILQRKVDEGGLHN